MPDTGRLTKRDKLLTGEGGKGYAWSRIMRPQESMVLYKSLNTLCRSLLSGRSIRGDGKRGREKANTPIIILRYVSVGVWKIVGGVCHGYV
jgi:hypothetical protein